MNRNGKEAAGNMWTINQSINQEVLDTGIEDEEERGPEVRKEIRSVTSIMATHAYRKNPEPTRFATKGHIHLQGSSRAQRE